MIKSYSIDLAGTRVKGKFFDYSLDFKAYCNDTAEDFTLKEEPAAKFAELFRIVPTQQTSSLGVLDATHRRPVLSSDERDRMNEPLTRRFVQCAEFMLDVCEAAKKVKVDDDVVHVISAIWSELELFRRGSLVKPAYHLWVVKRQRDESWKVGVGLNPDFRHHFTEQPFERHGLQMTDLTDCGLALIERLKATV